MQGNSVKWATPSLVEFEAAIDRATNVLRSEKSAGTITGGKISGSLVEIGEIDNLVIVGDLHGDYECLSQILKEINYATFVLNARNKLVFLGDYVDRGSNSIGVLYSVCQLKVSNPDSIVLMRGNHEAPSEFPFASHDFPFQLVERFGEAGGRAAYRKSIQLFKDLIIATIVARRLMLVHGGLPTEGSFSNFRAPLSTAQEDHTTSSVLEQVLWNDPRDIAATEGWEISRRGLGRHFGQAITQRWLEISGTRCVVRGHEPCPGFRIDHDGRILTLFSSQEPYPSFRAAYLSVKATDLENILDARDLVPYVKYPRWP